MAIITGTNAADLLIGVATSGDDTVSGLGGDDLIAGKAGDDILNGGTGVDVDILIGGSLEVAGGVGTVVLYPGDRDTASFAGRSDPDPVVVVLSDTETIDITRFGISLHLTGVGREILPVGAGDILVGIKNLIGGSNTDYLNGDSKDNIFYGKDGDDYLYGAVGNDILAGGIDILEGAQGDRLDGGAGSDILIDGDISVSNGIGTLIDDSADWNTGVAFWESATGVSIDLSATQTVDVTRAGVSLHLQNAVVGHGGDAEGDLLVGIDGLDGSELDDHLVGGPSVQYLDGWSGNDVLENAASLSGGAGSDTLISSGNGSAMRGGPGADVLDGRAGGNDSAHYHPERYTTVVAAVTIDLTQGVGHGWEAEGDVLIGIESVYTTEFDDRVIGAGNAETMVLYSGNNVAYGLSGADDLQGGWDSDRLVGGAGADKLSGGGGYDWAYYHTSPAGVTVGLAGGTGTGGEAQGDTLSGIEAIYGSIRDDALTGDDFPNTLLGNTGADRLAGGGRADTFMYRAVSDSTVAGAGRDVILDFSQAEGDKINLWAIDADGNAANGNTAFVYAAGGAFTGIGHEVVVQSGGTGVSLLYADLNGDKVADFAIEVQSAIQVTGSDLVL